MAVGPATKDTVYEPVPFWAKIPHGIWMKEATSVAVDANDRVYVFNRSEHPVIIYDQEGKFRPVGGAVDHISITAKGFDEFKNRFEDKKVTWKQFAVPGADIVQLFVRDPNGILIELNFTASQEGQTGKSPPAERQFMPGKF